jgi:hypothetical protein
MTFPKITDDDHGTITATLDGRWIRSWEYATEQERRVKMRMAREFAEGWYQSVKEAQLTDLERDADLEAERARMLPEALGLEPPQ